MQPWLQLGTWTVPSFLLVQSLNASVLLWWAARRAHHFGLSIQRAMDLAMIILFSGLIGGRLLHVVWEAPGYYRENPTQIFNVLAGGYVYFGGLFFALVGALVFFRITKETQRGIWFDFFAPIVSLGTAIGRIGCFLAGCCYGKICTLPWAVPTVDEQGLNFLRHPTALYSFFWEIGVLLILLGLEKKAKATFRPGCLFAIWLVLHGTGRFIIEFLRDDFRGPRLSFLSISQVISLFVILLGCLILRHLFSHPPESPAQSPR